MPEVNITWHGSLRHTGRLRPLAGRAGGAMKSAKLELPGGTGPRMTTVVSSDSGMPSFAALSRPRWSVPRKSVTQNKTRAREALST